MDFTAITAIVSVAAALSGIVLGWAGRTRSMRDDIKKTAGSGAVLAADVEYIKRGVDDIRLEQRAQGQRIDVLSERVTRVEESAKAAHKRMDRIDGTPRDKED
ncbi:hypothetical protein [Paenibacillus contaminans]|uniref:Uncharacterized protein n=1 Tax=Paenibacillus contaminans TaxID=450362 RepID=A0A329MG49_9BACL|nr:hypothetical protein [Paenibacillus contaminans]RAV18844.1 hypothetical protein DQG23_24245 [Paenibacillus contaminans]